MEAKNKIPEDLTNHGAESIIDSAHRHHTRSHLMPPRSEELLKPWKCAIGAELAGTVEYALTDPVTKKPRYGARKRLLEDLLKWWLSRESGTPQDQLPDVASLEQLRSL